MSRRAAIAAVAGLALAGCTVEGKPVVSPSSGPVFERAQAICKMRARDDLSRGWSLPDIIEDAVYDCFQAGGVHVAGFRQRDGSLTRYPIVTSGRKKSKP